MTVTDNAKNNIKERRVVDELNLRSKNDQSLFPPRDGGYTRRKRTSTRLGWRLKSLLMRPGLSWVRFPKEDVALIREKATFDLDRILEIEEETRHDVVAFTRAVSESLGEERKWVHYGLTSTDVVDTAYGYLYKQANDIIRRDLETLPRSSPTRRVNTSTPL